MVVVVVWWFGGWWLPARRPLLLLLLLRPPAVRSASASASALLPPSASASATPLRFCFRSARAAVRSATQRPIRARRRGALSILKFLHQSVNRPARGWLWGLLVVRWFGGGWWWWWWCKKMQFGEI